MCDDMCATISGSFFFLGGSSGVEAPCPLIQRKAVAGSPLSEWSQALFTGTADVAKCLVDGVLWFFQSGDWEKHVPPCF